MAYHSPLYFLKLVDSRQVQRSNKSIDLQYNILVMEGTGEVYIMDIYMIHNG